MNTKSANFSRDLIFTLSIIIIINEKINVALSPKTPRTRT